MSDRTGSDADQGQPTLQADRRRRRWDNAIIAIADVPWGLIIAVIALLLIAFGGKAGLVRAAPMLTAAGLFGIGHGIHTAAKVRNQQ